MTVGTAELFLIFPGQVTRGGVVSTTVTVNAQVLEPPKRSVALQTTLLWPRRKPLPEGGTQRIGTGRPETSTAVRLKVTGVRPPVHSATIFVGQVSSRVGIVTC